MMLWRSIGLTSRQDFSIMSVMSGTIHEDLAGAVKLSRKMTHLKFTCERSFQRELERYFPREEVNASG